MNICIDYDNSSPMYEQIENKIKSEIYMHNLQDNEPLPSVRQLSAMLNVSAITVKRAYADLEREGFIYTIAGKGTFVRMKDIQNLRLQRQKELKQQYKSLLSVLKEAGVERKELYIILEDVFKETEEKDE